jgi:hypothetical protein
MTDALLTLEVDREVYPKHRRNQIACQEMRRRYQNGDLCDVGLGGPFEI